MPCNITQADLGPAFADPPVDPALALLIIEAATAIVLGPVGACQVTNENKWRCCCVDPCQAIKLLASHLLSTLPTSGATNKDVLSERVGDVSVTYGNATSTSGLFAGSIYGSRYALLLGQYETCSQRRNSLPFAVAGRRGCGC